MSKDVYKEIDFKKPIHTFVFQCAPVIAGLKPSNLLIIKKKMRRGAYKIAELCFLKVFVLYEDSEKLYLLVYNPAMLNKIMRTDENLYFLNSRGYDTEDLLSLLSQIAEKYGDYMQEKDDFPHELGILFGYPLRDVYRYMQTHGQGFILNGYWKVYSKPEEAKETFRRYDEVTEDMMKSLFAFENFNDIVKKYSAA